MLTQAKLSANRRGREALVRSTVDTTHLPNLDVAGRSDEAASQVALPDGPSAKPSVTAVLAEEFADEIPADVVERVTAAARHALERSHLAATAEAVERLARERLHAKAVAAGARPQSYYDSSRR
jgi:hypothetical protein